MIRQWFESLSARDQIALMILGAAVGLWAFVFLIFIELDGRRERLVNGNQALTPPLRPAELIDASFTTNPALPSICSRNCSKPSNAMPSKRS